MASRLSLIESWLKEIPMLNVEVIFVVDNSDDLTFEKLERIKQENCYSFITIQDGNFGGPGGARNVGLMKSQGRWVTFWDSDDRPEVSNFLSMVRSADDHEKSIAIGGWGEYGIEENDISNLTLTKSHRPTFIQSVLNPGIWRWAFRTSEINDCTFPNILMGEDQIFLANLHINWRQIFREDKTVYNYISGYTGQLTSNKEAISARNQMYKYFDTNLKGKGFSIFTLAIKLKLSARRIVWWA
jgi:glycosyltransferase involved in cell wall biosynthesis